MDQRRYEARERVRELARRSLERGDALAWFEEAYRTAEGDASNIPWADRSGHPLLVEWLAARPDFVRGKRALVVGCGLGEDAEELARAGAAVTAFDLSPTAIEWCAKLWPESRVDYHVANLLDAPAEWRDTDDFVLEIYTLQALPPQLRGPAGVAMAACVAPGGSLLAISRAREEHEPVGELPWPLLRSELEVLSAGGLREAEFESVDEAGDPPVRHWRARFER